MKIFILLPAIFLLNIYLLKTFKALATRWHILIDYPSERSTHKKATIRGAGLIFVLSTLLAWIALEYASQTSYMTHFIIGAVVLAIVSFLDDLSRLPVRIRLLVHILAATVFISALPLPSILHDMPAWTAILWYPFAIFFITASINLYNFMDGIDGMSALHGLCVCSAWILLSFFLGGDLNYWLLTLMAPLAAFLCYNWHPAKIFMGDIGSTFLGYSFSCLAMTQLGGVPRLMNFVAFILLMMPFLFDTSFTVISRLLKGRIVHLPHRDFLFHRLIHTGMTAQNVSMLYGFITLYNLALLCLILEGYIGVVLGLPMILLPYFSLYSWAAITLQTAKN